MFQNGGWGADFSSLLVFGFDILFLVWGENQAVKREEGGTIFELCFMSIDRLVDSIRDEPTMMADGK